VLAPVKVVPPWTGDRGLRPADDGSYREARTGKISQFEVSTLSGEPRTTRGSPHTDPMEMAPLSPSAKASWRRFWRNGPDTPRQVADEALARIAAAKAIAETPADLRNLLDPYDFSLADQGTDPQIVHLDRARRVHAGQTARRLQRLVTARKHSPARRGGHHASSVDPY
jgi:hypothetical protein